MWRFVARLAVYQTNGVYFLAWLVTGFEVADDPFRGFGMKGTRSAIICFWKLAKILWITTPTGSCDADLWLQLMRFVPRLCML